MENWLGSFIIDELENIINWTETASNQFKADPDCRFINDGASNLRSSLSFPEQRLVQIREVFPKAFPKTVVISDGHTQLRAILSPRALMTIEDEIGHALSTEDTGDVFDIDAATLSSTPYGPEDQWITMSLEKVVYAFSLRKLAGFPRPIEIRPELDRLMPKVTRLLDPRYASRRDRETDNDHSGEKSVNTLLSASIKTQISQITSNHAAGETFEPAEASHTSAQRLLQVMNSEGKQSVPPKPTIANQWPLALEQITNTPQPATMPSISSETHGWTSRTSARTTYSRRKIPDDQANILTSTTSWVPSLPGNTFPPCNVPLRLLSQWRSTGSAESTSSSELVKGAEVQAPEAPKERVNDATEISDGESLGLSPSSPSNSLPMNDLPVSSPSEPFEWSSSAPIESRHMEIPPDSSHGSQPQGDWAATRQPVVNSEVQNSPLPKSPLLDIPQLHSSPPAAGQKQKYYPALDSDKTSPSAYSLFNSTSPPSPDTVPNSSPDDSREDSPEALLTQSVAPAQNSVQTLGDSSSIPVPPQESLLTIHPTRHASQRRIEKSEAADFTSVPSTPQEVSHRTTPLGDRTVTSGQLMDPSSLDLEAESPSNRQTQQSQDGYTQANDMYHQSRRGYFIKAQAKHWLEENYVLSSQKINVSEIRSAYRQTYPIERGPSPDWNELIPEVFPSTRDSDIVGLKRKRGDKKIEATDAANSGSDISQASSSSSRVSSSSKSYLEAKALMRARKKEKREELVRQDLLRKARVERNDMMEDVSAASGHQGEKAPESMSSGAPAGSGKGTVQTPPRISQEDDQLREQLDAEPSPAALSALQDEKLTRLRKAPGRREIAAGHPGEGCYDRATRAWKNLRGSGFDAKAVLNGTTRSTEQKPTSRDIDHVDVLGWGW